MKRDLLPGRWNSAGHAVPDTGYVLHPELHRITLTEIDNDVAPDAARTFSGLTSAEKRAERERSRNRRRANWLAAIQCLVGLVGFAATLALLAPKN